MNTNYEQTEKSATKLDRTVDFSNKIAKELIDNFSPKEQREFLNHVEKKLLNYYSIKIDEAEHQLKTHHELRNQFQGETQPAKL